jgi:1-deoxy-D-xylulose-5-phosphate reductoisomerase
LSDVRRVVVLGSTGSIGRQALEVAAAFPERIAIVGLAAGGSSSAAFAEQVRVWRPDVAVLAAPEIARRVAATSGRPILSGTEGLLEAATWPEADLICNAIVGFAGLAPTLAALEAGKDVALANKEPVVAAGNLVLDAARRGGGRLLPVDSEPSAIFQLLVGRSVSDIDRVILTASGGPFYGLTSDELETVTPGAALHHPTWRMGPKISVDSATLMNKGFEVLEASWLFGLPVDRIEVLIHRVSLVHSLVVLRDGAFLAHLGPPDMRYPIQQALTFPMQLKGPWPRLDLAAGPPLQFHKPDSRISACLNLAYEVGRIGKSLPAVLSAADEVLVAGFLGGRCGFGDIPRLLREVVSTHVPFDISGLADAIQADAAGRQAAEVLLSGRD